MIYLAIKLIITALTVVAISEAAKRWAFLGAIIASLPLTTVLAMIWLHLDGGTLTQVSDLSRSVFWIVIPSLVFFLTFPIAVRVGLTFWPALSISCIITAATYFIYLKILGKIGVEL